jgi:hypothetical protein
MGKEGSGAGWERGVRGMFHEDRTKEPERKNKETRRLQAEIFETGREEDGAGRERLRG